MILMFCNRLLVKLKDQTDGKFPISPLAGSYMIGVASCVFALLGVLVIKYLGRKTIFAVGLLNMGICHVAAGVCIQYEWYLTGFIAIIVFIAFFNMSVGNVTFIYTSEVAVDKAAGLAFGF